MEQSIKQKCPFCELIHDVTHRKREITRLYRGIDINFIKEDYLCSYKKRTWMTQEQRTSNTIRRKQAYREEQEKCL